MNRPSGAPDMKPRQDPAEAEPRPAPARPPLYDESKEGPKHRLERRAYREANVSGFPHLDQEVAFFTQVAALLRPDDVMLDFGAGRGEFMDTDPSSYRAWLQNFKGRCAHVDGCDPDPVVLDNPTLDAAAVIEVGQPLPYEDERFDLIISRYAVRVRCSRNGNCLFAGAIVHAYGDPDPARAAQFHACTFRDDPKLSPTGQLFFGRGRNRPVANLPRGDNVLFNRCEFTLTHDAVLPFTRPVVRYADCVMVQASPARSHPKGTYLGANRLTGNIDLGNSIVGGTVILNGRTLPPGLVAAPNPG